MAAESERDAFGRAVCSLHIISCREHDVRAIVSLDPNLWQQATKKVSIGYIEQDVGGCIHLVAGRVSSASRAICPTTCLPAQLATLSRPE
ncbi:hypothetical protein WOLCODRAFT_137586 [Wolfiporia cocos MD-104 SS10]|uniref:Uncharacterized protein n=1 Tax=Wolfiporia cocos (strain MD-104) TaxID=742152 RepID=A0A2H3JYH7_WOLCO|nr:hypothetical protein WOLCODRAFT_137586 [Wolfiporia cocos MD-104 SS10]